MDETEILNENISTEQENQIAETELIEQNNKETNVVSTETIISSENSAEIVEAQTEVQNTNETEIITVESVIAENETEKPIGVYVKKDERGNIIEVNSDIFITDFTGWEKIDEGYGDKYAHAQSQWIEQHII